MPTKAPLAAKPTKSIFDPFNSSATGHQRAENRLGGSTSWRDSRSLKLRAQFTSGAGGGDKRISDTVGAGSLDFGLDGRTENGGFLPGAKGLRTGGQRSLWETMKVEKIRGEDGDLRPTKRRKVEPAAAAATAATPPRTTVVNPFTPFRNAADGSVRESSWTSHEASPSDQLTPLFSAPSASPDAASVDETHGEFPTTRTSPSEAAAPRQPPQIPPQIFANLTFYINGSTAPHSDHRIKHLLSHHGGRISVSLARRAVTHVILGRPNNHRRDAGGGGSAGGGGGGLAASKIQKEVGGGRKVRYVAADWVVESVGAGRRLPEARFEAVRLAPKGVGGIAGMFAAATGKWT
jgi:hypothetical protein